MFQLPTHLIWASVRYKQRQNERKWLFCRSISSVGGFFFFNYLYMDLSNYLLTFFYKVSELKPLERVNHDPLIVLF